MRLKTFILGVTLATTVQFSSAQTYRGCRSGGIIYTTPPAFLVGWTAGITETCPPGATSSMIHAVFIRNAPAPNSCPVGLLSLGGSGTLVDYQIINCSIDKWVNLSILPMALLAILKLHKRSKIKYQEIVQNQNLNQ